MTCLFLARPCGSSLGPRDDPGRDIGDESEGDAVDSAVCVQVVPAAMSPASSRRGMRWPGDGGDRCCYSLLAFVASIAFHSVIHPHPPPTLSLPVLITALITGIHTLFC